MTRKSPITVVVLSLVTFGLYALYWLYASTDELRREAGREDLSPAADVLLTIVTFGLWGMYAVYRNAGIIHEELSLGATGRGDKSPVVAIALAATFFSGWAWLVAIAIVQEELNALSEVLGGGASVPMTLPTDAMPMPVHY